jgi:hypothetical protein
MGFTIEDSWARQELISRLETTGPVNSSGFLRVSNLAFSEAIETLQGILLYFDNGISLLSEPAMRELLSGDGVMGTHGTNTMLLYVFEAIDDEISPADDTDSLVNSFCDAEHLI